MADIKKLIDDSWAAVFEQVRITSVKTLENAGQDAYNDTRPFIENIARWSADYALALAQDDPGAEQARAMIVSQLEMIAVHLSHEARRAFYEMVERDLIIIAGVLGTILKAAIA